jgi:hypothetical protein
MLSVSDNSSLTKPLLFWIFSIVFHRELLSLVVVVLALLLLLLVVVFDFVITVAAIIHI